MENNDAAAGGQAMRKLDPIKKLWSDTWQLYGARFDTFAKIILIPAAIVALGSLMAMDRGATVAVVLGGLISFIGFIVFIFAEIALLIAVVNGTDFKESYRRSPGLFWSLVWVSVLGAVVTLGGIVMLIVPGIMMGIWFAFSRYLVIAENRRGMGALTQSREYARGYWWAIFGRALLMGIAVAVVSGIVSGILIGILGAVLAPVVSAIIWIFVVPFAVVYSYVLYKNLALLKPELATTQADTSRGFLKASGIVGIIGIILIPIAIITLVGFAVMSNRINFQNPTGIFNVPSSTVTGTSGY
jgi:hypothetical protein